MPSQAMQDLIDAFRDQQKASASQAPPALEERRATFAPAGRIHPVPDDVLVTEVTAGGVPAHWLTAPRADTGRVLLFLHGGGFELGSLRSDGELAARLGRASGMRVLFPEYRLAPEHPFPAAIDDALAAWRWLRTDQDLSARSLAGLPPLLVQVGTADLLLSDSERLATAAAEAGVDVTLEIGEGLPHVYQILLGTPEAAEATEQIGKFLRTRVR
jgi:acetyl esterase/lipase